MIWLLLVLTCLIKNVDSFSTPSGSSGDSTSFSLFDRFRHTCPADPSCIRLFDESLIQNNVDEDETWVAVYRSSNNKPSVLIKDEFLNAMRDATGAVSPSTASTDKIQTTSLEAERPVAVARLHPSIEYPGSWVLDSMRCVLKKENMDSACDGGSEHTEALSVGIDALLIHHLSRTKRFENAIRTKATLISGALVEARGFRPLDDLCNDMATHVSSLDRCLERYADRVVALSAKNPSARDRALQIVSLLGEVDRDVDMETARKEMDKAQEDNDQDGEVDPWAGMRQFL